MQEYLRLRNARVATDFFPARGPPPVCPVCQDAQERAAKPWMC
jgi:hypothetical protein